MKKIILLFAVAAFTFSECLAQMTSPDTATKNFIIKASIGGLQEINSGRLAVQKASDPEVKSFGGRMIMDHSKAQEQLMQLAKATGYQVPPQAAGDTVPDAMLKNTSGKDFDRMYVHMMVPDHRRAVHLFQTYAVSGKDPEIKAYAQQTLPILKEHLAAIIAIDKKMTEQAAR